MCNAALARHYISASATCSRRRNKLKENTFCCFSIVVHYKMQLRGRAPSHSPGTPEIKSHAPSTNIKPTTRTKKLRLSSRNELLLARECNCLCAREHLQHRRPEVLLHKRRACYIDPIRGWYGAASLGRSSAGGGSLQRYYTSVFTAWMLPVQFFSTSVAF